MIGYLGNNREPQASLFRLMSEACVGFLLP